MVFYYKYYLEIRNRTVLTITNWIFVTTTCYYYKEILLFLLVNLNGNFLSTNSTQYYFIFTNISELFSVYLDLIFFISNQTTIFFLIYHSVLFISSGLYKSEYKKLIYIFKIFLFSLSYVFSNTLTTYPFSENENESIKHLVADE